MKEQFGDFTKEELQQTISMFQDIIEKSMIRQNLEAFRRLMVRIAEQDLFFKCSTPVYKDTTLDDIISSSENRQIDNTIAEAMYQKNPGGEDESLKEVTLFKLKKRSSLRQIYEKYEELKLKPACFFTLGALNISHNWLASHFKNCTHWNCSGEERYAIWGSKYISIEKDKDNIEDKTWSEEIWHAGESII